MYTALSMSTLNYSKRYLIDWAAIRKFQACHYILLKSHLRHARRIYIFMFFCKICDVFKKVFSIWLWVFWTIKKTLTDWWAIRKFWTCHYTLLKSLKRHARRIYNFMFFCKIWDVFKKVFSIWLWVFWTIAKYIKLIEQP